MHTKNLQRVQIKNAEEGVVSAVFATLGVKDHDGDVIVKGAVTDGQPVRISAYGHRSWSGELPVGKGIVREVDNEAVFEGQFFLNTTHGRDTFETVKAMSEGDNLQEWSFSLENVTAEPGEIDGEPVNLIKSVDITEVSPVLKGAGINTRTLAVKDGLRDIKFTEHAEAVLAAVKQLAERTSEVIAFRAEQGKEHLAEGSVDLLTELEAELKRLEELLRAEPDPDISSDEAAREFARFVANIQGV